MPVIGTPLDTRAAETRANAEAMAALVEDLRQTADRVRQELAARGVLLEDSAAGTRWKRK